MRLRLLSLAVTGLVLVAAACITDPRPIIAIAIDPPPPDTVTEGEFQLAGQVVRSPPDVNAVFTITAIREAASQVDTTEVSVTSVGAFTMTIAIIRDTIGVLNRISLSAVDQGESSIAGTATVEVIGLDQPIVSPPGRE